MPAVAGTPRALPTRNSYAFLLLHISRMLGHLSNSFSPGDMHALGWSGGAQNVPVFGLRLVLLVSVGTWFQVGWVALQALIPAATLKEYIAFARARCQPELSPDAATDLIQGYCDMRRMGTSRKARHPPPPPPPHALLLWGISECWCHSPHLELAGLHQPRQLASCQPGSARGAGRG